MIFFTIIIFISDVICWNITTYKNMDVKLLHPVWKDFLDTVNTVVLTGYWKQLIIFLFDIQCFYQSGSECGPWTKIIWNSCLVIQKIDLDFFMIFFFIYNVRQWWNKYWCRLLPKKKLLYHCLQLVDYIYLYCLYIFVYSMM